MTLTLSQVSTRLHIDGIWPEPVTYRRGWAKAHARPWNDASLDAAIRLERGRADFLRDASRDLAVISSGAVFSPPMFDSATRVWRNAGFEHHLDLDVFERPLDRELPEPEMETEVTTDPLIEDLLRVDRAAFEGFWGMSAAGLSEAMTATPTSVAILVHANDVLVGYALVGTQWSASYLQRIGVVPEMEGEGVGSSLLRASLKWGRRTGAKTMVLNVRPGQERVREFYRHNGFRPTGSKLTILHFNA